jgi:hypothetical protein
MKKTLLSVLIVAVVVGGGAFYGGMKYGQSTRLSFARQNFGGQQMGANMGGLAGGRSQRGSGFASGEIIAKDEKSITVKLPDGGSKIVFYSNTTEIGKFVNGTAGDLTVGKSVIVSGTANPDGSVTAQSVQIRPLTPVSPGPSQ